MIHPGLFAAWRRAMRRHQDLPQQAGRTPMWRLLGGEVVWGLRQLVQAPWVLLGLLVGGAATFAVLDAAAPGPVLEPPWRVLVAIVAGLLIATGIRRLRGLGRSNGESPRDVRPVLGAAVVSAAATALVLLAWLVAWTIEHFAG